MPENVVFQWIDDEDKLQRLCKSWSSRKWLALDTEFVRERTYYPIPALMQISDGEKNILIDLLTIKNWTPLSELFQSEILWVMHSCSEDIEVLHLLLGETPKQLFDTQVACNFLGLGQSISYQKLIEHFAEITLDKGATRTDWLKRPLASFQLRYAANDVSFLAMIWQQLRAELQAKLQQSSIETAFEEDMDILKCWHDVNMEYVYQKVKGAAQLKPGAEINRLQQLAYWREQEAQQQDKPRRFILDDNVLVSLAKENPTDTSQIHQKNIISERLSQRYGKQIINKILQANKLTSTYPAKSQHAKAPLSRAVLKAWKICAADIARQHQLDVSSLYSNRLLDGVFQFMTGLSSTVPAYWNNWRCKLLQTPFEKILQQQRQKIEK